MTSDSRTAQVRRVVQARIVRLEMAPGSAFTEADIAEELDVSKTPVREALAMLAYENYLETQPRSGYRVAPLTLRDAMDLSETRATLEAGAVAQATALGVGAREAELRALAETDPADREAFVAAESRLHELLTGFCNNGRTADACTALLPHAERFFRACVDEPADTAAVRDQHRYLVDAVCTGDVDRAAKLAAAHVAYLQSVVLRRLLRSDAVLDAPVPPLRALAGTPATS